MYSKQEIEDYKKKLDALPGNHYTEIAKKARLTRATVVKFFKADNESCRPTTIDRINDATLAYIEALERKLENRNKKARRLIYGEKEGQEQPGRNAVQGKLNLNS